MPGKAATAEAGGQSSAASDMESVVYVSDCVDANPDERQEENQMDSSSKPRQMKFERMKSGLKAVGVGSDESERPWSPTPRVPYRDFRTRKRRRMPSGRRIPQVRYPEKLECSVLHVPSCKTGSFHLLFLHDSPFHLDSHA